MPVSIAQYDRIDVETVNDYYADPVEAIKFRMEQEGLTPRDLEPYIGQSGRVSEVLNRRRPLSLRMVKRLHDGLKIPYESLMAGVSRASTESESRNAGSANLH